MFKIEQRLLKVNHVRSIYYIVKVYQDSQVTRVVMMIKSLRCPAETVFLLETKLPND